MPMVLVYCVKSESHTTLGKQQLKNKFDPWLQVISLKKVSVTHRPSQRTKGLTSPVLNFLPRLRNWDTTFFGSNFMPLGHMRLRRREEKFHIPWPPNSRCKFERRNLTWETHLLRSALKRHITILSQLIKWRFNNLCQLIKWRFNKLFLNKEPPCLRFHQ